MPLEAAAPALAPAARSPPPHTHPSPPTRSPLPCGAGEAVVVGQPLLILEAMKMEHVLKATVAGVVEKVGVAAGELVEDSRVCMAVRGSLDPSTELPRAPTNYLGGFTF